MFKDYYSILEVDSNASAEDIKSAYRRLSKKWHPDVNHNVDVTSMMQDINEAYYILKNAEKRHRYDEEYNRFKHFKQTAATSMVDNHSSAYTYSTASSTSQSYYYNYDVRDEEVWADMETARTEAAKLVKEFLNNLKKDAKKAAKGAWEEIYSYLIVCVIFIIIGLIIHSLY